MIVDIDLKLIWNALEFYREHGIPEGSKEYDEEWNEICTNMAWIKENLGFFNEAEEFTIEGTYE